MKWSGFTLAELLIALAILGVIATFTIPKILASQQDTKYQAMAKEAVATVAAAYTNYKMTNTPTAATRNEDLIPYINAVKQVTGSTIDQWTGLPPGGYFDCGSFGTCLLLHNGAVLQSTSRENVFLGTTSTDYITFTSDPDAKYTGKTDSLRILLYFDGRVTTGGAVAGADPGWFKWN